MPLRECKTGTRCAGYQAGSALGSSCWSLGPFGLSFPAFSWRENRRGQAAIVIHGKLPCECPYKHRHTITIVYTLMNTLWPNIVSLGLEVTHRPVGMASSCLTNSHHAVQERGSKLTHSGTCSMFCSEHSKWLINRTWILWSLLFTLNDLIARFSRSSDTQCFLAGRHALSDWASYCGPESKCWCGGSI